MHLLRAVVLTLGACPCFLAHAQDPRWELPARGVVVYERSGTSVSVRPPEIDEGATRLLEPKTVEWRYLASGNPDPAKAWASTKFDDAAWSRGVGEFADNPSAGQIEWRTKYVGARAEFSLPSGTVKGAVLHISHDDGVVVWLNGIQVFEHDTFKLGRRVVLDANARRAFRKGRNVLAVRCDNTGGAAFLGVGINLLKRSASDEAEALAAAGGSSAAANALRDTLFPEWRAPALLFDGELHSSRAHLVRSPIDIRELGRFVATDLRGARAGRKFKIECPRMLFFGDVQLRGHVRAAGADGRQIIEVVVKSIRNALREDNKHYVRNHVDPNTRNSIEAVLRIERRFDPERGIVASFDVDLSGWVKSERQEKFELSFTETWNASAVRENRDREFRAAVVDGIRRSAEFLRSTCEDLSLGALQAGVTGEGTNRRSYGSGTLALCALAMIKGGIPADDPVLAAAYDALREREIVDTYSLGCALMAFEALYAPIGERADLLAGTIDGPRIRTPSESDRKLIERWAALTLENVDTRLDRKNGLRFNYVRAGRFDTSVNQYGLLGLYAAQLCGVDVSVDDWRAAVKHLVASRERPGETVRLSLGGPATLEALESSGPYRNARPSGWGYYEATGANSNHHNPVYGSMTCAGITGLAVAQAGLRLAGFGKDAAIRDAQAAMHGGFAWLSKHFTVRWNPGYMERLQQHYYYYLYGMERACELAGVALIDGRDWYFEAATTLLAMQREDGSWPGDRHAHDTRRVTSMGLLVLKKESMPVFTGK